MWSKDQFRFLPAFVAIVVFAAFLFIADISGELSFYLIFYAFAPLSGALAVMWLGLLVRNIWKDFWRNALSVAAIPFIVGALSWPINYGCDYTHLLMTKNEYDREIANLPEPQGKRFAVFDWSVDFAGSGGIFLLYDESDQIALPAEKHTKSANNDKGFGSGCGGHVVHLLSHYYVCRL